jgi:hypothetical protein
MGLPNVHEFQFKNGRKERKMNVDRFEEVTVQDLSKNFKIVDLRSGQFPR